MSAYLIKLDKMKAVGRFASTNDAERVGTKANYDFDIIESKGDNLGRYTNQELVTLYNNHCKNHPEVSRFSSRDVGLKRLFKLLDSIEFPIEKKTKHKKTYMEKLREIFPVGSDKRISKAELAKILGTNENNAAVSVSIARNPNRVKDPINVQYDRKTKEFYIEKEDI